eukprot:1350479-Rhodomonas_salina.1
MLTSVWNTLRYVALILVTVAGLIDECSLPADKRIRCTENPDEAGTGAPRSIAFPPALRLDVGLDRDRSRAALGAALPGPLAPYPIPLPYHPTLSLP